MYMSGVLFAVIDLIVSLLKKLDMILTGIKLNITVDSNKQWV